MTQLDYETREGVLWIVFSMPRKAASLFTSMTLRDLVAIIATLGQA